MAHVIKDANEILAEYLPKVKALVGKDVLSMLMYNEKVAPRIIPVEKCLSTYRGRDIFVPGTYYIIEGEMQPEMENNRYVARFNLHQLQGCCGVCVSHGAEVYKSRRGIGTVLNQMRIEMVKNMGYGTLLSTDVDYNVAQRKILAKNGWKDIYSFKNPRTHNNVNISVIPLVADEVGGVVVHG